MHDSHSHWLLLPTGPQLDVVRLEHLGEEDCLYLSVYVPSTCTPDAPCPVLQWIYGQLIPFFHCLHNMVRVYLDDLSDTVANLRHTHTHTHTHAPTHTLLHIHTLAPFFSFLFLLFDPSL